MHNYIREFKHTDETTSVHAGPSQSVPTRPTYLMPNERNMTQSKASPYFAEMSSEKQCDILNMTNADCNSNAITGQACTIDDKYKIEYGSNEEDIKPSLEVTNEREYSNGMKIALNIFHRICHCHGFICRTTCFKCYFGGGRRKYSTFHRNCY